MPPQRLTASNLLCLLLILAKRNIRTDVHGRVINLHSFVSRFRMNKIVEFKAHDFPRFCENFRMNPSKMEARNYKTDMQRLINLTLHMRERDKGYEVSARFLNHSCFIESGS